jgi:adenosylmethionine-8-amino-7-oxononanoate aminotransferase
MRLWRPFSIPGSPVAFELVRGEASSVSDREGRAYLDAAGGLWNVALGLNHAGLLAQMERQLHELAYASLFDASHVAAERLCERLLGLTAGRMQTVYLSTTGSTAVEVALRAARLHFRARGLSHKRGIMSFDRAYHGSSGLGIRASGILADDLDPVEACEPGFALMPSPTDEDASLKAIANHLEQAAASTAAFILEPVLGSAGVIVPSPAYGAALSALCRRHDVLLIADEVATGIGRCGAMLASDLLELQPDILALSKGLNSGYYPMGATLFAERVVQPIARAGLALQYGSTQDGNPVGCAAALATLDVVEEQQLCRRANRLGAFIRTRLHQAALPVIREVRGLGLMIAIELAHPGGAPFSPQESAAVRRRCQDEGLLTYHFDHGLSLFPALTMSDADAEAMIEILHDVLDAIS